MAVNFRMGRRGAPLTRLNAQPRSRVTVWKPLGEPVPPLIPITLVFGTDNILLPVNITDAPEWFDFAASFTLTLPGTTVTMEYDSGDDSWFVDDGDFKASEGTGTLTQGANSWPVVYSGATYIGDFITAASLVRIVAMDGVFITWAGV